MYRPIALVAVLALCVSGCAVTGRSLERWGDDKGLVASVKTKIVGVSLKNLTMVNVDVYDGVVYLSGVVDNAEIKRRTEQEAARVEGVRQVVSDLSPRDRDAVSALPVAALREQPVPAPLAGVVRLEGTFAFDRAGHQVATVYTVPISELAQGGPERFTATRPIDHVTVHAMDASPDVPMPHYLVVLWHVAEVKAPN
jgi:hypothetical protein